MDYTMEDTQNSAPEAHEASKLGSSAQRSDTQSVTKRCVTDPDANVYLNWRTNILFTALGFVKSIILTVTALQPANRADAAHALTLTRHLCLPQRRRQPPQLDRDHQRTG